MSLGKKVDSREKKFGSGNSALEKYTSFRDIADGIEYLKESLTTSYRGFSRKMPGIGFYTMVGVTMVASLISLRSAFSDRTDEILDRLPKLQVQVRNVGWGPEPEEFYDINGKRVYYKIDCLPVENHPYFNGKRR